jgi:hypothetical protein
MAKKVLRSAKAVPKVTTEQLTDDFLLSKERQIGDRMFWLLGYTAETEAENDEEMEDSFAAIIDTLSSFLEAGTPLVGDRLAAHVRLVEDFYTKARKEHQRAPTSTNRLQGPSSQAPWQVDISKRCLQSSNRSEYDTTGQAPRHTRLRTRVIARYCLAAHNDNTDA